MHKIKLFGRIYETRYSPTYLFELVGRDYFATGLQIFLDENKTIGFGTGNIEDHQYQRLTFYRWSYKKSIKNK